MVFREIFEHMFQFLVETLLHNISFINHFAMNAYVGVGVQKNTHILDLETAWRCMPNFTPWPLYFRGNCA
jgi:hypothetical protein